jgi:ABC-2 type transport system ATP-binding protein
MMMMINNMDSTSAQISTSISAVEVKEVSKKLRGHQVLNNVDLFVNIGEITGIYGANGSGKTMLLRVISGLVLPDTGTVRVFDQYIGRDAEFPQDLGALINGPGFILDYDGLRNLELLASIRNLISKVEIQKTIELVGLDPNDRRPVKAYSTGMRQRLGIAQAIMENPNLLLMDEPTSALDFDGTKHIHKLLKKLQDSGVSTVIVSHNREEIIDLCNQIYEMRAGTLIQRK